MSPIPLETRDRWHGRIDPSPGEGAVYWHVLLDGSDNLRAAVRSVQTRLAKFGGFHLTPENRLHLTTLHVGSTEQISTDELDAMLFTARNAVGEIEPPNVTLRKILYHPEAIVLGVTPADALEPIHLAVANASAASSQYSHAELQWRPHVTIAYSTVQQSMAPIVEALGRSIPEIPIDVASVELIIQWGPERAWNWQMVGTAHLGTNAK